MTKKPEEIKKGTKCPWCGERMRFDADSVHCWFKCDNCLAASPKTRHVWDNAKGNKDNWDINKANARILAQQFEAQVPRWISEEERLPEHDVRVLFGYARYGYVDVGHLDREDMEWLDRDEIQVASPSHWMPLPEPPKEDGHG